MAHSQDSAHYFVLAGPTAVGKSELAVEVAERCGGEIVGADAFQLYAGLEMLTAKPSAELRTRVRHHLVGEIPLSEAVDVARYRAEALRCIAEIRGRGKVAIVCGGNGLYLRALSRGLADLPPADAGLRAEMEAQPLAELQRRLADLDPAGAARIDLKNPRRVIRALEVCMLTGKPFSSFQQQWAEGDGGAPGVVLVRDRAELYARIDLRTRLMFAEGVEEEVARAGECGPTASQTLGLREIRALLAGEIDRAACIAAIQQATRHYAKRQLTWFRREPAWEPVNLTGRDPAEVAATIADTAASALRRL